MIKNKKRSPSRRGGPNKRRSYSEQRKENYIYFENGIVIETLPAAMFKIKVNRKNLKVAVSEAADELPPIFIVSNLKSKLIKKKVLIIKGDIVTVEVNPEDMYYNQEDNILKGTIIERK